MKVVVNTVKNIIFIKVTFAVIIHSKDGYMKIITFAIVGTNRSDIAARMAALIKHEMDIEGAKDCTVHGTETDDEGYHGTLFWTLKNDEWISTHIVKLL